MKMSAHGKIHAEHPRYGLTPLCGARGGVTVADNGLVTCKECQRRLNAETVRLAQQQLIDAQEKQAEKAELLRRNGPRMVKLLRRAWMEINPRGPGELLQLEDEISALFRDLGENIEETSAALSQVETGAGEKAEVNNQCLWHVQRLKGPKP